MSTTILAIWGAFLSTALAAWNIYKDLRDRGYLRVEAYLTEWDDEDEDNRYVTHYKIDIVITNTGKRSIVATRIGVSTKRNIGPRWWNTAPPFIRMHRRPRKEVFEATFSEAKLPRKLEPGDFVEIEFKNAEEGRPGSNKLGFLSDSDNDLFVLDSLGRYFFVPRATMRRIRENHRPSAADNTDVALGVDELMALLNVEEAPAAAKAEQASPDRERPSG